MKERLVFHRSPNAYNPPDESVHRQISYSSSEAQRVTERLTDEDRETPKAVRSVMTEVFWEKEVKNTLYSLTYTHTGLLAQRLPPPFNSFFGNLRNCCRNSFTTTAKSD